MSTAIIGFGAVGQALAQAFARKNMQVTVASRRVPEAIASQAKAIGPTVTASSMRDALRAQIVMLAVPFGLQNELAKAADWEGKIVIDATNAYGVSPDQLGGLPSSVVNARALVGSRLVKAFNHLPARSWRRTQTSRAGGGAPSCRAMTATRPRKWRSWSNNSVSHPSILASSTRAVYSSRRADPPRLS